MVAFLRYGAARVKAGFLCQPSNRSTGTALQTPELSDLANAIAAMNQQSHPSEIGMAFIDYYH
jgi:hypothetical protein